MSSFLQPTLYGPIGGSADTNNLMLGAAQFITSNQAQLQHLLTNPSVVTRSRLMKVTGSTVDAVIPTKWIYTLQLVLPTAAGTAVANADNTELTAETGYNLAEFGNTATIAAGGVDVARANSKGFILLPVPIGGVVNVIWFAKADGTSVALFDRMNAWDGECVE